VVHEFPHMEPYEVKLTVSGASGAKAQVVRPVEHGLGFDAEPVRVTGTQQRFRA